MEKQRDDIFLCFGGYGDQYWTGIAEPTIRGNCKGVTVCRLDRAEGTLHHCQNGDEVVSPGTLTVSPDGKYVYAANETSDFTQRGYGGGVSAFSFDRETGSMRLINQTLSYGAFPAYISIDSTGKYLLVANHGSKLYCTGFEERDGKLCPKVIRDEGCVSLFCVREDGGVGELLDRIVFEGSGLEPVDHASAHPHSVVIDDRDYIIISDKGADCVYTCRLNRDRGKMELLNVHHTGLGTSPRHAVFVPGTDYVMVINEYDGHLNSFRLNRENGALTPISRLYCGDITQEYMHPFYGRSMKYAWSNDVQLHPNGRFAYANIDQQMISLFYIDHDSGVLQLIKRHRIEQAVHGTTRGMQIDPSGQYLIAAGVMNEKVFVYRIDSQSGELTFASEYALPTPTALCFVP